MRLRHPFYAGALLAFASLVLLWRGVVWQFGAIPNGIRYLLGYNCVVDPLVVDVGEGPKGAKRSATVAVRNLTFWPIRVIGVVTTCNCVAATGLPFTVAPREAKELHVRVSLECSAGDVSEIADVLIDDGRMQRSTVVLRGRCIESK